MYDVTIISYSLRPQETGRLGILREINDFAKKTLPYSFKMPPGFSLPRFVERINVHPMGGRLILRLLGWSDPET